MLQGLQDQGAACGSTTTAASSGSGGVWEGTLVEQGHGAQPSCVVELTCPTAQAGTEAAGELFFNPLQRFTGRRQLLSCILLAQLVPITGHTTSHFHCSMPVHVATNGSIRTYIRTCTYQFLPMYMYMHNYVCTHA